MTFSLEEILEDFREEQRGLTGLEMEIEGSLPGFIGDYQLKQSTVFFRRSTAGPREVDLDPEKLRERIRSWKLNHRRKVDEEIRAARSRFPPTSHAPLSPPVCCTVCRQGFASRQALTAHQSLRHPRFAAAVKSRGPWSCSTSRWCRETIASTSPPTRRAARG